MRKAIIAFDCDGTLEISNGPIRLARLMELKQAGLVVGIVGNWMVAIKQIKGLDFYQAGIPTKAEVLKALGEGAALKIYVADTDEDKRQAYEAGWNFLRANEFR